MIDYKKVEQAKRLLDESGAQFVLAYDKGDKQISSRVNGEYPTVKRIIITAMWQAVRDVYSQCGVAMAVSEALDMARTVMKLLFGTEKATATSEPKEMED